MRHWRQRTVKLGNHTSTVHLAPGRWRSPTCRINDVRWCLLILLLLHHCQHLELLLLFLFLLGQHCKSFVPENDLRWRASHLLLREEDLAAGLDNTSCITIVVIHFYVGEELTLGDMVRGPTVRRLLCRGQVMHVAHRLNNSAIMQSVHGGQLPNCGRSDCPKASH